MRELSALVTVLTVLLMCTGCTGDPFKTAETFASNVCSGNMSEAQECVVEDLKLTASEQEEFLKNLSMFASMIKQGMPTEKIFQYSSLELQQGSKKKAAVIWHIDTGKLFFGEIAGEEIDPEETPEEEISNKYVMMEFVLTRKGGKWLISEIIPGDF